MLTEGDKKLQELEPQSFSLSFVMLKPLGAQEPIRSLVLEKLQGAGEIVDTVRFKPTREQMFELYKSNGLDEDGNPKPYLNPMLDYYEGKEVEIVLLAADKTPDQLVKDVDDMIGYWDPNQSQPGEIRYLMKELGLRYDLDLDYDNLIHSPASAEEMQREIAIFVEGN